MSRTTDTILNLLEFEDDDLEQRKSEMAEPEEILVQLSPSQTLNSTEQYMLNMLMKECRLDRLLVHSDTDLHLDHFSPPTGFAATFHSDTTFHPSLFEHPFRIFSSVTLDYSGRRWKDVDILRWKKSLNLLIRDESPIPPIYGVHQPDDPWFPSLGPLSWIGLGEKTLSTKGKIGTVLYVYSGLDGRTWRDVQEKFYQYRKKSYAETMDLMTWCRNIVQENARRLLYLAATGMQLGYTARTRTSTHHYPPLSLDEDCVEMFRRELGITDVTQLTSAIYVPPHPFELKEFGDQFHHPALSLHPHDRVEEGGEDGDEDGDEDGGEHLVTLETKPHSIQPDMEIFVDDLIDYPHQPDHLLRLSNCCALEDQVVRMLGPEDDILIYEVITSQEDVITGYTAQWLHAFPSVANIRLRTEEVEPHPDVDVTWEAGHQVDNPYLKDYQYEFKDELLDGVDLRRRGSLVTIQPVVVRVTTCLPQYHHKLN